MLLRKLFFFLAIVVSVSESRTFGARRHAEVGLKKDKHPEKILTANKPSAVMKIPRGGGVSKSDVVRLHGLTALAFGAAIGLGSIGIDVPILGPASAIAGWDSSNGALVSFARFTTGLLLFVGLSELEFSDSTAMQKLYVIYHIPLAIVMLLSGAKEGALNWLYGVTISLYGLAGIIAK